MLRRLGKLACFRSVPSRAHARASHRTWKRSKLPIPSGRQGDESLRPLEPSNGAQGGSVRVETECEPHVLPQAALQELLERTFAAQRKFLFGNKSDGSEFELGGSSQRSSVSFLDAISNCYEGRMLQEQQVEIEAYARKRQLHYDQRLKDEVDEFRRERREVHSDLQRIECDKYKSELGSDIKEFMRTRQKECEGNLKSDVEKYFVALKTYRSRQRHTTHDAIPSSADSDAFSREAPEKDLHMDTHSVVENMELEEELHDYGSGDTENTHDVTDGDIRAYVEQRLRFYEASLQEELDHYIQRRKSFYEELFYARSTRHAAQIREDTEKYRSKRQRYYEEQVGRDALWMEKGFREHYERCFLHYYARQIWLSDRLRAPGGPSNRVSSSKSDGGREEGTLMSKGLRDFNVGELQEIMPLSDVLTVYEKETMSEVTRDVFLKAARRLAGDATSRGSSPSRKHDEPTKK